MSLKSLSPIKVGQYTLPTSDGTNGQVLTTDGSGNVTFTTVTVPNDKYLSGLSFDTATGVLTATVANGSNVTQDLDGRYLELGGGTMTGNIVMDDSSGASPNIQFTNQNNDSWYIYTDSNGKFQVQQSSTIRATFSSGDLEVRTPLVVDGNITTSGDYKVGGTTVINSGRHAAFVNLTTTGDNQLGNATTDGTTVAGTLSVGANSTFSGRTDLQKDLRIRGNDSSSSLGVVRLLTDSNNQLIIDTGNDGSNQTVIDGSGNATFAGDILVNTATGGRYIQIDHSDDSLKFADGNVAKFGTGNDLRIQHTGSESQIFNSTGQLDVRTSTQLLVTSSGGENMIRAVNNAGVFLYYDNSVKFETYAAGAGVTGSLYLTSGNYIQFDNGVSNDYSVRKNSTNLEFKTGGGYNFLAGNATFVGSITAGGSRSIFAADTVVNSYSGTAGVEVYKNAGDSVLTIHQDDGNHESKLHFRTGGNDTFFVVPASTYAFKVHSETTSDAFILSLAGDATFKGNIRTTGDIGRDDHNRIMFSTDNSIIFRVSDSHRFRMDSDNFSPYVDSSYDLGTSSKYFRAAYIDTINTTGDLTVGGNLIVSGTTTTINTATVEVEDNILQLNTTQGSPDTATAATSGISVYRGNGVTQASLIFDDGDDTWDLTNNLVVAGNVTIDGSILTHKRTQGTVTESALSGSATASAKLTTNYTYTGTNSSGTYARQDYLNLAGSGGSFQNVVGYQMKTNVTSTGTGTAIKNILSRVHTASSGDINNVAHFVTHNEFAGTGDVGNWAGLAIADLGGGFENSRTITNTYGIKIGDITHGTQTNAPYAIHTGSERVYFGGQVGIGTDPAAGVGLHVSGEIRVDDNDGVAARKIRSSYFSSSQNLDLVCGSGASLILGDGTARLTLASNDTATFAGDVVIGDNQKLHGGRVHPRSVYSTSNTNGFLIATDVASNNYAMIQGEIDLIQFNSSTKQRIEFSATLNNNGTVFNKKGTADIDITIKLFVYNSKWYVHVPQPSTYTTCTAYISKANAYVGDDDANNSITNLTSAAVPSSGVTGSTDIVCKFSQGAVSLAGNIEMPSSTRIRWGAGDAQIEEGSTANYALDFSTYDGSNMTKALTLLGNNNASFTGHLEVQNSQLKVRDTSTNHQLTLQSSVGGNARIMAHKSNLGANQNLDIVSTQIDLKTGSISGSANASALLLDSSKNATFAGIVSVPTGKTFRMYNAAGSGWGEIALNETDNKIQFNRGIQPSGNDQSDQDLGTSSHKWNEIHATQFESGTNAVKLKNAGNTKLLTTGGGVDITGALAVGNINMTGALDISATYPRINLNDTNHEDDWSIINDDGSFKIYNVDDSVDSLKIDTSNNTTFGGDIRLPSSGKVYLWTGHNSNFLQYNVWQASASGGMFIKNIASAGAIYFQTNSTTAITIDSSQNTTFAGEVKLALSSTTQRALSSTGTNSMQIGDAGTQMLRFKNAAGVALDIAASGDATFSDNVTIGALTSGATAQLTVNNEGGVPSVARFKSRTNKAHIEISDNDTTGYISSENGFFSIGRNAGVNAAHINIDGSNRVLIGATSTAFNDKLYVNGDAYNTSAWRVGTSATYVGKMTNNAGKLTLESDGDRDIQFQSSNNASIMYIDTSTQRIGIGTTSPGVELDIFKSASAALRVKSDGQATIIIDSDADNSGTAGAYLHYRDTGATKWTLYKETNNDFYLYNAAANKYPIHAKANGHIVLMEDGNNLGVGVSSPGYKLEVGEDTDGTADLLMLRNSDATYAQTWGFQSDTNKDLVITGSSGAGGFKFVPGSRGTHFTQKVGIGTAATSRDLSVFRSTAGSIANFLHYTDASNFSGLYINVSQADDEVILNASGSSGAAFIFQQGNSQSLKLDTSLNATFAGNISVGPKNNATVQVSESGGSTVKMLAGSVGRIGTYSNHDLKIVTNSTDRLTISAAGAATFTGSLSSDTFSTSNAATFGGNVRLQSTLQVLNKAQSSYINLAARDTSGSEVVYNLSNVGSITTDAVIIDKTGTHGRISAGSSLFVGGGSTTLVQLSSKLIPDADSSRDLGATNRYWKDAYIDTITTTGDITIGGNINVTGDINSVSVTDLDVTDKTITVGKGQNAANSSGSGIAVERSDSTNPSLLWNQSTGRFDFNTGLTVTGQIHTTGSVYAKGSLFVVDTNGTSSHIQARSNGTEGFMTVSNGSNWGLIMRGPANDPRIGAYHGGTLKIEGFHSSDGATGSNAIDFAQFQFGNDHFQMNAATSTFAGKITATGDPGVVVTGSGNSTIHVASTGTGLAGMYMDASNGDFVGSDYVFIGQDNDKTFRLESFNSSGDILLKESNTNTLRLSGGNATFAGSVQTTNLKTPQIISAATNQSLFIYANGSGHIYFGDSGNGNNLYHYSTANDGKYTTYDWNGNYYRISTTATSGVWINEDLKTSNVTASSFIKSGGTSSQFLMADGSVSTGGGSADNLGNHTATQALDMDGNNITDAGTVTGVQFLAAQSGYADGYKFSRSGHDSYRLTLANSQGLRVLNETDSRTEVQFIGDGSVTFYGNVRATLFSDQDNTAYWLNPAGAHAANLAGRVDITTTSDVKMRFKSPSTDSSDWGYIEFYKRDGNRSTYFGINGTGEPVWATHDGGPNIRLVDSSDYVDVQATSLRASSFIDRDNIAYLLNPAETGTSLNIAGSINIPDSKMIMWGGNSIVSHSGSATTIGDNSSGSVLTIASGDADFTGNVEMQTGNSVGKFAVMSSAVHGSYDFYNNGTSYFNGLVVIDATCLFSDNEQLRFGGANDFLIYHNSTTNVNHVSSQLDRQLSINANIIQLTNQANSSTYLKLESSKATLNTGLNIGGSIGQRIYAKNYGSLDTTGQAVAGLLSGSNGNSASFVFETAGGGSGGYQRVVFSCINVSGTWTVSEDINEGGDRFDITSSGNGSTVTFTFKARSSTQSYSPKVNIKAFGSSVNETYF